HAGRSRAARARRCKHLPDRREPDAAAERRSRDPRAPDEIPCASERLMSKLTHIGSDGEARMVDVSGKAATDRQATAEGRVVMRKETLDLVLSGNAKKG